LLDEGNEVLRAGNFFTGRRRNVAHLLAHPRIELLRNDITFPLHPEVDQVYKLACPAAPRQYRMDPVQTMKVNVQGSIDIPGLAKRMKAYEEEPFASAPLGSVGDHAESSVVSLPVR